MPNTRIPNVVLADNLNIQRQRFNQLLDSVGNVSTLTTTDSNVVGAINEHDAELGTITAGAMGTTASTVSTAINELDGRLDSINTTELLSPRATLSDSSATSIVRGNLQIDTGLHVGGNTTMSGTLNVDGEITFKAGTNSNINLGDANTDNVIFNADVNSSIIPNTDDTFDLGSSTQEWRHVYVDGTVFADNVAADSATIDKLVVDDITIDSSTISDAGDFTLDVGGGIILDADDAGTVSLKDGGTRYGVFAKSTNNFDIQSTISDGDVVFKGNDGGSLFTALTLDMSEAGDATFNRNVFLGGLTATAGVNSNAGITIDNITIDGTEIDLSSGDLTIDVAGDIILDAAGGDVFLKDNGTQYASLTNTSNNLIIKSGTTTALTFTGADAAFSGSVTSTGDIAVNGGDLTTTATTFNFVNANATTLNMGSDATVVSIGNHSTGITTVQHDLVVDSNLTVHGISNLDSTNVVGTLSINGAADITGSLNVTDGFTVGGTFTTTGTTRNASSHFVVNDGVAINNSNRAGLAVDRPSGDSAVFQWNEATDVWEFAGPKTGTVAVTSDIGNGTINISGGTELETGGSFTTNASGNSTITIDHSNVSRSDTTSSASPGSAGTFTAVDSITSNARGHITAANVKTITMPTEFNPVAGNGIGISGSTFSVAAGSGLNQDTSGLSHSDTSSQSSVNNSGRTYIQDITLDTFGHVTGLVSATETVTNTNQLTTFTLEDGDGTEVTIAHGKEIKFVEGGGVNIDWTDTSDGSDADPYDLTFTIDTGVTAGDGLTGGGTLNATRTISHADTSSQASSNNSGRTYIQDITLDTYGHVTGLATATETVTDTNTTDWRVANSSGSEQFAVSATEQVRFAGSGATSVAFDASTQTVTISSTDTNTDTNTTYTAGNDLDLDGTTFDIEPILNYVSEIDYTSGDFYLKAGSDIYLRPTGDEVFMQGITSGEEIRFQMGTSTQTIDASDSLLIQASSGSITLEATSDIFLKPSGQNVTMRGSTSGEQIDFSLGTTTQIMEASDDLSIKAAGDIFIEPDGDQVIFRGSSGTGQQLEFSLGADRQYIIASDELELDAVSGIYLDDASGKVYYLDNGTARAAHDFNTSGQFDTQVYNGASYVTETRLTTNGMSIANGLYVGSASGTPANDEIRADGNITAFYSSDISLKENIVKIDHAMDKIQSIRGVYFDWTDEHIESRGGEDGYFVQKHDVGVIAQEVEPVLPEVVRDRKDGTKAVDYQKMVAVLIEGMKEQQQQINELRSEIQNLKG